MLNSGAYKQQQQAYGQYRRVQAETSSPGQLVLMLYQGCVRFTQRGRLALEAQDFELARTSLLRSQDIVADLMGSLNLEAGEIATNLFRLYEYLHRRLVDANIKRDAAAALEVENLVRSLIPAWEDAVRQQSGSDSAQPGAPAAGKNVSFAG